MTDIRGRANIDAGHRASTRAVICVIPTDQELCKKLGDIYKARLFFDRSLFLPPRSFSRTLVPVFPLNVSKKFGLFRNMHISKLFAMVSTGLVLNVAAIPIAHEHVYPREEALNAGYRESFIPTAPEKRALNADGYRQVINTAAEDEAVEKRALNAIGGYRQVINTAAEDESVEKREAALNAVPTRGYDQGIIHTNAEE